MVKKYFDLFAERLCKMTKEQITILLWYIKTFDENIDLASFNKYLDEIEELKLNNFEE